MATLPGIQVKYKPLRAQSAVQLNWIGAQATAGRRGWWPAIPAVTTQAGAAGQSNRMIQQFGGRIGIIGSYSVLAGPAARTGFAVFEITTGALAPGWAPVFKHGATAMRPYCLAWDGTYLYVGGDFDSVNAVTVIAGRAVGSLVRFDYNGNLDTTWNPSPDGIPAVVSLEYNPDRGTLYVGGTFAAINGTVRTAIAEVRTTDSGTLTAWAPEATGGLVRVIRYDRPNLRVYIGGDFTGIGGAANPYLVRCVAGDAYATDATWLPVPNSSVYDVMIDAVDGTTVYAGGVFTNIGGAGRNRVAALDNVAVATSWNPNASAEVYALAQYRDVIFLGGRFGTISAIGRTRLAAVLRGPTATVLAWNPGANDNIAFICLSERTLYVTGDATSIYDGSKGIVRIPYPIFTDTNAISVAKTGSDANAGTLAAPVLTVGKALSLLAGAMTYAVIRDSGTYDESNSVAYSANEAGGVFAADGQTPTITRLRGAASGTYGARIIGRTKFSTGAAATFYHVSKSGNDGTGARGNASLPFLTLQGALSDGARVANDTVQIEDSGTYIEDLDAAALAVTIQAAAGKVPSLITAGGAIHVKSNAAVAVNLYGLLFADPPSSAGAGSIVVRSNGSSTVSDCSFSGGFYQVQINENNRTYVIQNCLMTHAFSSNAQCVIGASTSVTVVNCFMRNGGVQSGGTGMVVDHCTLTGDSGAPILVSISAGAGLTSAVTNCAFSEGPGTPSTGATPAAITVVGAGAGGTIHVDNCSFDGMSGAAILHGGGATGTFLYENCVAFNCSRGTNAVADYFHSSGPSNTGATWRNLVSLSSAKAAFSILSTAGAGTVTTDHCVALNAATYGFGANAQGTVVMAYTNCAEDHSGTFAIVTAGGSTTPTFDAFIFGSAISGVAPTTTSYYFNTSPQFVNVVRGQESVALAATSSCVNGDLVGKNVGIASAILTVTSLTNKFSIDGVTVTGATNFMDGLTVPLTLANQLYVEWCSFTGLAVQGTRAAGLCVVRSSLFAVNGLGINVAGGGATVQRCVGENCLTAFLYVQGPAATIEGNSASGCGFGQYDAAAAAPLVQRDNVYSESGGGGLDYSGSGTQATSDVENISASASVTGSRRDPLFRDVRAVDLRLQAVEAGYPYNSPAKGLAHDGRDAGAFDVYYGPIVTTWTLIDFGAAGFYNPFTVDTGADPIKLTEGDTFGLVTYSDAPGFKTRYALTWPATAYMTAAQVAAMIDLYVTGDGECQISFDGGATFKSARLIRSVGLTRSQLQGLYYSTDQVPEPIRTLVFRESS